VKITPAAVLEPALGAMRSVVALLGERQPTGHQVRLVRAMAKLCTVIGEIMFNTGQFVQARELRVRAARGQ
jgi:hypothetical protein